MTKTKTARLSLTMPGPIDAQQEALRPLATDSPPKTHGPSGMRRPNDRPGDSRKTAEGRGRDIHLSKTSSPSARGQQTNTSERSGSPTTPTSPTLTSLPPYPASPETSSKHVREQSRSFFANLKASKSSAKIQPLESTIRKVPRERSPQDENSKKPNRTKSTPDLRGTTSSEPVPDLPSLDSNQLSGMYASWLLYIFSTNDFYRKQYWLYIFTLYPS